MMRFPNLEALIDSPDTNNLVIELDNFIGDLCAYGDEIDTLTPSQRYFYLNQSLEREVNNGGFDQYFLNSSGDNAHDTLDSLKAIGASRTVALLQRAIDVFPDSKVPKDREERGNILQNQLPPSAREQWNELDEAFFAYEDDLNSLNLAFVRANIGEF